MPCAFGIGRCCLRPALWLRCLAVLVFLGGLGPRVASADLSLSFGVMNEYYFRGVDQGAGGGVLTGALDYVSDGGMYGGVWGTQLDGEYEYDLYAGYAAFEGVFYYSLGYTGYFFSAPGRADINELNIRAGYGPLNVEYSFGEGDGGVPAVKHYDFLALTGEYRGLYFTYGDFGKARAGDEYVEVGYGFDYRGLGFNIAAVDPNNNAGSQKRVLFSVSKSFDL